MEEYVLDGLAATAEAVLGGSGPLVVMLVSMLADLAGAVVLDELEQSAAVRGRELQRMIIQHALDAQAAAEQRRTDVTGADGVPRTRAERGRCRTVVTTAGPVRVSRIAYRAPGAQNLHPRDAVLDLPARSHSWQVQRMAVEYALEVSYEKAAEFLHDATGVRVGKLQVEQMICEAARDAEQFYPAMAAQDPAGARDGELAGLPLVLSADGKGVAMLPGHTRPRRGKAGQRARTFGKRLGPGEKAGHKRMAEVGCVFDARPAQPRPGSPPRTPEAIMTRPPGAAPPPGPQAVNRWYTIGITADRARTISTLFDQAASRDPGHERIWVALVDGDNHQIQLIMKQAAQRGIKVHIVIDFIHVLEYLWKAAWCFCPAADPAAEQWVIAQALDILHGRAGAVTARIRDLAAADPPRPGGEHDKNIRKVLSYLDGKQDYLDYPRALASGWPIATGVIEGACRHLVLDRMGITGARWSTDGAQAILSLRAIWANNDQDTYWTWHIQQEHHRNHTTRYQQDLTLAA